MNLSWHRLIRLIQGCTVSLKPLETLSIQRGLFCHYGNFFPVFVSLKNGAHLIGIKYYLASF